MVKAVLAANSTTPLSHYYAPAAALGGNTATLSLLLNPLIKNVILFSGIFAFFVLIFAGFSYITSGGDKNKITQSQNMLNYAIMGIVVIVAAYLITLIIETITGVNLI